MDHVKKLKEMRREAEESYNFSQSKFYYGAKNAYDRAIKEAEKMQTRIDELEALMEAVGAGGVDGRKHMGKENKPNKLRSCTVDWVIALGDAIREVETLQKRNEELEALMEAVGAGGVDGRKHMGIDVQRNKSMEKKLNSVYAERNALAVAFCKVAIALGWEAGRGVDSNPDWQTNEWHHVVYVDLPNGEQVSWHMSPECVHLLEGLPTYEKKWNGKFTARNPEWCKFEVERVETQSEREERIPEGWKLVPIIPTKDMVDRGIFEAHGCETKNRVRMFYELVYEGMLKAAPKYEE